MASVSKSESPVSESPKRISPRLRTPGYATSIKGRSKMESIKQQSHTRASIRLSVGRKFYNMEKRCARVKRCIEHATLLKEGINFNYIIQQSDNSHDLQLNLRIDQSDTNLAYCNVVYYRNNLAKILMVESTVGHSTGVFLLNIQLLICALSGVRDITLENYTDDDVRAAVGIYREFVVDKRGHSPKVFQGKTLKNQLHAAEGQMRLAMRSTLKKEIETALCNISKKVAEPSDRNPWNLDYATRIGACIRCFNGSFGGSRKMKKQSTRKKRHY